jgi:hypothetical protein
MLPDHIVAAFCNMRNNAIAESMDGVSYSIVTCVIDTFLLDDKHADDRQSLYHAILAHDPEGLAALRVLLGVDEGLEQPLILRENQFPPSEPEQRKGGE